MTVLKDRQFRDMRLTEDDAEAMMFNHPNFLARHDLYLARTNPETGALEITESRGSVIIERAKRLLPLWREWGMNELIEASFAAGWDAHNEYVTELDR